MTQKICKGMITIPTRYLEELINYAAILKNEGKPLKLEFPQGVVSKLYLVYENGDSHKEIFINE